MAFIKQEILEFKNEVRLGFASLNAKTRPNLNDYFPADDNSSIERFLNRDDGYEERLDGLYLLLSGCSAETPRKFTDAFLRTLFSKEYIVTHIWPLGR